MKCEFRLEDSGLKIRLDAENNKESAELFEAANACKTAVTADGYMANDKPFVWLNIPLTKRRTRDFGNRKRRP